MRSWVDVVCAVIGLGIIAGAHVWFFSSERHSAGINFQQSQAERMMRMPCEMHPEGMDGIPCQPGGLMPPKPPY
ncbi:hypothetical protein HL667_00090 [Bradyrhizobium sp. 83012]|uniref:Uncharacterized protein n=1 Tax=Bradyrhizobium aeschynomenes TaxID=2734909 RepID=A0ABX2C536_9BRAD|nr:hypothetical protein [Bradyrhizobium aeschynomenes]NPU63394.1 hypothetical protein [Bradyrhizobium aeschynomenes]